MTARFELLVFDWDGKLADSLATGAHDERGLLEFETVARIPSGADLPAWLASNGYHGSPQSHPEGARP